MGGDLGQSSYDERLQRTLTDVALHRALPYADMEEAFGQETRLSGLRSAICVFGSA